MHILNYFKGKTILVTGGTGFIGTHLVSRLRADENIRLVLLSKKPVSEDSTNEMWICSSLDDLSPEIWRQAGVEHIDILFHLGAFTPKFQTEADRVEEVYRDNLIGTRSLLDSLPSPPDRVIFTSTIDVYAVPPMDGLLDEDSPLGPSGLYGISKLFCEQLIRVYATMFGCGYSILRYGHIFGPGEGAYGKLIPQMIRRLLQGEEPVLYGDGSAERAFLYVSDAVEATLRAAVSNRYEIGPINIVRDASASIRSITETLIRITGFAGGIKYLTDKPNGYPLRFDNRRMREVLGEWNFVSLEEGLKREVDYFRGLCP
jgi:nucleoside-diphosphate-sugar epimerase